MLKKITAVAGMQLFAALLFFTVVQAQTKTISGTVTSQPGGTPMAGVSINLKDKTTGTQTNAQGTFIISATPSDLLVVSYLGFVTQEIPVGNNANFNITLSQTTQKWTKWW